MGDLELNRSRTALLMADFHADSMGVNPVVKERHTFERAGEVLNAARQAGVYVVYIVVNFRTDYPEISEMNQTFSERKAAGQPPAADPAALIHESVLPRQGGTHRGQA